MKKVAFLLALVLSVTSVFTGCEKKTSKEAVNVEVIDFNQYSDSEEIPDWEGGKLKLVKWADANAANTYQKRYKQGKDDAVAAEFERITGVSFDADNSFDNGGGSYDSKIAQIIASEDYPNFANTLPELSNLVEIGALWNLEEYIEKYAPNVYRLFGPGSKVFGDDWQQQKKQYGGIYAIGLGVPNAMLDMVNLDNPFENVLPEQARRISGNGLCQYPFFFMRDDVLKKLYPQAHTVDELEAIFKKNGSFTEEEIFDVPIESPEDFVEMLYNIKALNLKDGTNEVYPTFTHNGTDNWNALVMMGSIMFGYCTPSSGANYFCYYDLEEGAIKYTFKEDWFKEKLKLYNQLVKDEVASKESMLDTNAIFKEKLNSGRYIVTYNGAKPNVDALGGKYKYRRVYVKYPIQTEKYLNCYMDYAQSSKLSFFKESTSEKDLIQALRALDFAASKPGQKLAFWGKKSAGLYEENEDGTLSYKDENLKKQMIDPTTYGTDLVEKYGLKAGAWPGRFFMEASEYNPKIFYSSDITWEQAFDGAITNPAKLIKSKSPNFYLPAFTSEIPEARRFWQARAGFEDALMKVFVAKDDKEFEKRYNDVIKYAEENGLTDETLKQCNEFYEKDYNEFNMDNLK